MRVPEAPRKARQIPVWVEGVLIAAFLGMAVIEGIHEAYFFAGVFGVSAIGFGAALITRLAGGNKHG